MMTFKTSGLFFCCRKFILFKIINNMLIKIEYIHERIQYYFFHNLITKMYNYEQNKQFNFK